MFAIGFDLTVENARIHHPTSVKAAYDDIGRVLKQHGFRGVQGSLYVNDTEDFTILFAAMTDLRNLPWLRHVVRDIRAFRVEQWSDFTAMMTAP